MASSEEERQQRHELRKAERAAALGMTDAKPRSIITPIKARGGSEGLGQLTKAEQELLRSKALTVEDNPWQRIQFTSKFSSLEPTYDPTVLSIVSFQNNTLRQCIAAMMSNIDGTGYDIKRKDGGVIAQIVSPDSPDPLPPPPEPAPPPPPVPNPTGLQVKPGSAGMAPPAPVTLPPKEVPVPGKPFPAAEGAQPIMVDPPDVARIKAFWDEPYPGISFMTMRSALRENLETTGNAYLEVIRDASGKIALLNPMDSKLTRMIRHDDIPVAVTHEINRTGIPGDGQKVTILVHERRYVQIIGLTARFFKQYKATRDLNAKTGLWFDPGTSSAAIPLEDMATEVLHFWVDKDVLTPYGVPRWINQMPSVMGSRKAEELNLEFFEHGGVPPVMIMIQGGTLRAQDRQTITDYLAGQAKYKQRGVILEIAPSGGDLNSAGQVKTDVHLFGDANDKDSKFEQYDEKCTQRVRSSFRLPAVLIGLEESYNYATVQTAVMMAEEQVFHPERVKFDELLNATLMKELDPDGMYVYESNRMTAKFLDEQIKVLTLAKGLVQGPGLVDAMNDVAGLDLKFDQNAADNAQKMQSAQLNQAQQPAGAAQAGTGDAGESTAGVGSAPQGTANVQFAGTPGVSKSSTSLGGSSTAINQDDVAHPQASVPAVLKVQLTKSGKIRKLDEHLLTDLTNDMAAWMNGDKSFLASNVDAMTKLVKTMTPAYQKLFAENVANKILKANHDPAGVAELMSCTSDVLARLQKAGGEPMATPKGLSKSDRSLYVSRAVTNAEQLIAWAKKIGCTTCIPPEDLHVTVCYSKVPFDTSGLKPDKNAINCTGGDRQLSEFGPEQDTLVLEFDCPELDQDHQMYIDVGASWDWPSYRPHVRLTLNKPPKLDVSNVTPFSGPIRLGPEEFADVQSGANEDLVEKASNLDAYNASFTPKEASGEEMSMFGSEPASSTHGALKRYSESGLNYAASQVNDYARTGHVRTGLTQEGMEAQLKMLDAGFKASPAATLYRGSTLAAYGLPADTNPASLVGKTLTDKGYGSTSSDESVVNDAYLGGSAYKFRIAVSDGAKVADMQDHATISSEKEVLLPRNAALKVTAYDPKTRTIDVSYGHVEKHVLSPEELDAIEQAWCRGFAVESVEKNHNLDAYNATFTPKLKTSASVNEHGLYTHKDADGKVVGTTKKLTWGPHKWSVMHLPTGKIVYGMTQTAMIQKLGEMHQAYLNPPPPPKPQIDPASVKLKATASVNANNEYVHSFNGKPVGTSSKAAPGSYHPWVAKLTSTGEVFKGKTQTEVVAKLTQAQYVFLTGGKAVPIPPAPPAGQVSTPMATATPAATVTPASTQPGFTTALDSDSSDYSPTQYTQFAKFGDQQFKALNPTERDAIKHYTGSLYYSVNGLLRRPDFSESKLAGTKKNEISSLDSGLDKCTVGRDLVAYRGLNSSFADSLQKQISAGTLKVGSSFTDPGYSSATISKNLGWGSLILKMNLSKDTKGLYVAPNSYHKGEKEILLPRGATWLVTAISSEKYGKTTLDVAYIPAKKKGI